MSRSDGQLDLAALTLLRWKTLGTPLSCVAIMDVAPDSDERAAIVISNGTFIPPSVANRHAMIKSEGGGFVLVGGWGGDGVEVHVRESWRGAMLDISFDYGVVIIADYDCREHVDEILAAMREHAGMTRSDR